VEETSGSPCPRFRPRFNLLYPLKARDSYFGLIAGTFVSAILAEMRMPVCSVCNTLLGYRLLSRRITDAEYACPS
jgi:hypothetical protein